MPVAAPPRTFHPTLMVTPWSPDCLGMEIVCLIGAAVSSAAVAAANQAYYFPWYVQAPVTVTSVFWLNGATAQNIVTVGVYDSDSATLLPTTRLVTGSATASGANTTNTVDVTDTVITPGLRYIALGAQSGSQTFFRAAPAPVAILRGIGILTETGLTNGAVPATATAVGTTTTFIPLFGVMISPRTTAP